MQPGQSLTFLGGTVLNLGTLTAPEGQITIAAVPQSNLVRLTQRGSLLSLEFQPIASATLPQLLTGDRVINATGVINHPDGTIQLTGSGLRILANSGTAITSGTLNVSVPWGHFAIAIASIPAFPQPGAFAEEPFPFGRIAIH
ncbi:hypothetical protein [Phormidesmis priestleyi]